MPNTASGRQTRKEQLTRLQEAGRPLRCWALSVRGQGGRTGTLQRGGTQEVESENVQAGDESEQKGACQGLWLT